MLPMKRDTNVSKATDLPSTLHVFGIIGVRLWTKWI